MPRAFACQPQGTNKDSGNEIGCLNKNKLSLENLPEKNSENELSKTLDNS